MIELKEYPTPGSVPMISMPRCALPPPILASKARSSTCRRYMFGRTSAHMCRAATRVRRVCKRSRSNQTIALPTGPSVGTRQINHKVGGHGGVPKSHKFLVDREVEIIFGSIRRSTGGGRFHDLKWRNGTAFFHIDEYQPRTFRFELASRCQWRSEPRPSFRPNPQLQASHTSKEDT